MAARGLNPSKLRDYCTLTKPEVNLLVLMTTAAGYYLASPGPVDRLGMVNTLLGTLLVASGTATLNQWMERSWDAQMRRTANRPVPAGRISPRRAFWFGISMSVAGGLYLAILVNWLAAVLAISTLLSYLLIYTPLKRRTPLCTLLGALPGAMPILIGWSGAAAPIDLRAWFLFAIVFLWQFPHFLAIALIYREDYDRAGYKMLPEFDADGHFTRAEIVSFTVILVAVTGLWELRSGALSSFVVTLAGVLLLYPAFRLLRNSSKTMARWVVHGSVSYLPVLLFLAMLHKR